MAKLLIESAVTSEVLEVDPGRTLFRTLLDQQIPPESVVVRRESEVVSDAHVVEADGAYEVMPVEPYDLGQIRKMYAQWQGNASDRYTKRHLEFEADGSVSGTVEGFDAAGLESYVERTIDETISQYDLLASDSTVLLGLSGELDSVALLYALEQVLDDTRIVTATIEEPWAVTESGLEAAVTHTGKLDIQHHTVTLNQIRERYGFDGNPRNLIPEIRESEYGFLYEDVLAHVHRNMLEQVAEEHGLDRIAMGSHASELVPNILLTRILNPEEASHSGVPRHVLGDIQYVHPACYVTKRELYLYYLSKVGGEPTSTAPDTWEDAPGLDKFRQYVADMLRSYWPGIEYWIIDSAWSEPETGVETVACSNCGKLKEASHVDSASKMCDVCHILFDLGMAS